MKNYNTFDEYQWEAFFREEEKNVRKYLNELPKYIDLPGEDLILSGNDPQQFDFYNEAYEYEYDDPEDFIWEEEIQAPVLKKIIELSRSWLLIQNATLGGEEKILGLQITAILAMISGRLQAITSADAEKNNGFIIAHCKHIRAELSKCEEIMRKINNHSPRLQKIINEKISVLAEISEFISDKIFDLRKKKTTQN